MSYSNAHSLTAFLCGALAMVLVDVVSAEMCKWVDEDGCVHYAETCPEGVESTEVEIQASPSPAQVDEAIKRSTNVQLQRSGREEMPSEPTEISTIKIDQMRAGCIKARLSLDALSQGEPVYYDKLGQLQAELHQSVQFEFDRSSSYLNADAVKRAYKHWNLVKQNNCTSAVSGSGISAEIRQKQKEHQHRQCEVWKSELEYMERNRGFHKERLNLKKLFNANCK
jgi:hypothetical protein